VLTDQSTTRVALRDADLGEPIGREQAGRRPAVVVSDNELNDGPSGVVIVVPVTTSRHGLPSHIELDDEATGLDHPSYARFEDVRSVSGERLIAPLGTAPAIAMFGIDRSLRFLLTL
jgi:mRNA interferase MazF